MSLSCSCNFDYDWDPEPGQWSYVYRDRDLDFTPFKLLRRKRCCSCGKLIGYGDLSVKFPRRRYPYDEIEARITGDTYFEMNDEPWIPMADHYQCEACAEIYFNLTELGFECVSPAENMPELLEEYKTEYQPKRPPVETQLDLFEEAI